MNMLITELTEKLNTFDVPKMRRELNIANVRWLLRNLPINNKDNVFLAEIMNELKILIKNEF